METQPTLTLPRVHTWKTILCWLFDSCCCFFVVSTLSCSCLWENRTDCGSVSRMTRIHWAKPDLPFFSSEALCRYSQIYFNWNSLKALFISQTDPPFCSWKCCELLKQRSHLFGRELVLVLTAGSVLCRSQSSAFRCSTCLRHVAHDRNIVNQALILHDLISVYLRSNEGILCTLYLSSITISDIKMVASVVILVISIYKPVNSVCQSLKTR